MENEGRADRDYDGPDIFGLRPSRAEIVTAALDGLRRDIRAALAFKGKADGEA